MICRLILKPALVDIRLAYWRWALREMGGAHPSAPEAVLTILKLEDQRRSL
jgi:hypothetical protein